MKAVVYSEYGGPDVLQLVDVEKPTPAEKEIFDNVSVRPLSDILRVLKPDGILVPNGGGSPDKGVSMIGLARMLVRRAFISQQIKLFVTRPNRADLQVLAGLMQAGAVTPVIDRCYPLDAAAEAFRHLESGHAHGKIVVAVVPPV